MNVDDEGRAKMLFVVLDARRPSGSQPCLYKQCLDSARRIAGRSQEHHLKIIERAASTCPRSPVGQMELPDAGGHLVTSPTYSPESAAGSTASTLQLRATAS